MSNNKKQHYVPQCYLRRFSADTKTVWMYDKGLGKIIRPSISNICCEKDLYTITEETVKENAANGNNISKLCLESDFFASQWEPSYNSCLNLLDNKAKECIVKGIPKMQLSDDEKMAFANHITVQFLRLPQIK